MTLTASDALLAIRGARVDGIAHHHDEILYLTLEVTINGKRKAYRVKAETDTSVVPLIVEEISEKVLSEQVKKKPTPIVPKPVGKEPGISVTYPGSFRCLIGFHDYEYVKHVREYAAGGVWDHDVYRCTRCGRERCG